MRILTLCDVWFPHTTGGAGRLARELAQALAHCGEEVHILTRRVPDSTPEDTLSISYFPPPAKQMPGRSRKIFAQVESQFHPDIIHVHQPLPAFLCLPSRIRQPVVYSFHSSWPEELKLKSSPWPPIARRLAVPVLRYIESKVIQRADAIAVESRFNQREVQRFYGRTPLIIPGGVNSNFFRPLPEPKKQDEQFHVCTLRNLVPRMGLQKLIHAFALLPNQFNLKIGGEGPLRAKLEKLIRDLNLCRRVRLCGHIPETELPRFYGEADLFVLPTTALEGFGLVILESLSCGTPVLGTHVGAIPEILSQFNSDWIIPAPAPQSIADSIIKFFQQRGPAEWKELHERVKSEFSWELIAARYREVFRSVLIRK